MAMSMILHLSHMLALGCALVLVLVATLIISRLFLHPLSKYPGPKLPALSNWYTSLLVGKGDLHLHVQKWHDIYGPIVRTGPNTLCFNTDTALSTIYGRQANVLKDDGYAAMSASRRTTNTMSAVEKTDVNFKRRVHTQFFSESNLRELEPRLLRLIDDFLESLIDESTRTDMKARGNIWSNTVDMSRACNLLTFDVITNLSYGQELGLMKSPESDWILQAVRAMSWRGMMCVIEPNMYKLKIDRAFLASAYQSIVALGAWAMNRTQARIKHGQHLQRYDLFQAMLDAKDLKHGHHFDTKSLWTESMLLLVAGSDSTSTAMGTTFFHLAHDPSALDRVFAELRSMFENESDIRIGSKLESCKYLRASVDEAMRLIPSVPNMLPRCVQRGGIVVDGELLPEGTILGCAQWSLHRNNDLFDDANAFRPERWLDDDDDSNEDAEDYKRSRRAFAPFGSGPRTCVGWRLALSETMLTVAKTLFRYKLRLAPESPCCITSGKNESCQYRLKGYAVSVVEGPYLQFSARY